MRIVRARIYNQLQCFSENAMCGDAEKWYKNENNMLGEFMIIIAYRREK